MTLQAFFVYGIEFVVKCLAFSPARIVGQTGELMLGVCQIINWRLLMAMRAFKIVKKPFRLYV